MLNTTCIPGSMSTNWSPSQLRVLQDGFHTVPLEELTRRVNEVGLTKTIRQCERMAQSKGMRRRDAILSPAQVAEELGVHPNTVLKWCRRGHMKAQRSVVLSCKMGAVWEVDQAYFERFRNIWDAQKTRRRRLDTVLAGLAQQGAANSAGAIPVTA